ncbi:MAG TPA: nickel pincer cofactor biosynthesis protein LarC [Methanospirillum sp.]|nr:nickel pincer cofactor biosynthesis protein LarC [Methanospirillum sp.]
MRLLAFDPFHGAAGDMICGALLGLGADKEQVMRAMSSVVERPHIETVTRCGIAALKVHTRAGPAHRTLHEVLAIVQRADAPSPVISQAERIFRRIAAAEEAVHGTFHVHFHEVGADDAIADVIGACMAVYLLSPDIIVSLPVAVGRGMLTCAHGTFPVPAPATAEILSSGHLVVMAGDYTGEQLTPTGAAILTEICRKGMNNLPTGTILKTGYGAGTRDDPTSPNVLRAFLMEYQGMSEDLVDVLETNVDDMTGECIGTVLTRVMEEGARDACAIPILMKKGRPGHLIRVIAPPARSASLAEILARELGTLGIRVTPAVHRFIARREIQHIPVCIHGEEIVFPVKFGYIGDACYLVKPEYAFAEEYARQRNIPVRDVLHEVTKAGKRYHTGERN